MRFLKVLKKNFEILFRLKTSLLAIIVGPLLVMLLIGFAFNSSSNITVSVGYNIPDNSSLSYDYVNSIKDDYIMKSYDNRALCEQDLKHSLVHTCILFPQNFVIENNKSNEVVFLVDKTRINIVHQVIESISSKVGSKSAQLSKGLTESLLDIITQSSVTIDSNIARLIQIKKYVNDASEDGKKVNSNLAKMNLDNIPVTIEFDDDLDKLQGYMDDLKGDVNSVVKNGYEFANEIEDLTSNQNVTDVLDDLRDDLDDINQTANEQAAWSKGKNDEIVEAAESAKSDLKRIEDRFKNAKTINSDAKKDIENLRAKLGSIKDDIDDVKQNFESVSQSINNIEITSSDAIVNPVTTKIETISSDTNQLIILFPYVLVLVIMFVGMLLSSTLVVVEKTSRAAFRVFTTPTRDEYFILTTFVTAFLIVSAQIAIILGFASYFLVNIITTNILVKISLVLLAASIFILIGMAIGYMFSSQQGTNMASISLGAVFLFISNIVLPLESISPELIKYAMYNPYVLASETLRRSILFNVGFEEILYQLILMLGYSVIIIILILISQRLAKIRYFQHIPHIRAKKAVHKNLLIDTIVINTEKDLVSRVQDMTDARFDELKTTRSREIQQFLKQVGHRTIARKFPKMSRMNFLETFAKIHKDRLTKIQKKHQEKNLIPDLNDENSEKKSKK